MALATVEPGEAPAPDFDEVVERGRRVASQISRLDAELVDIVSQIGTQGSEHWGMTTRQYIAWQFGLTPAESARVCRLATQLEPLPRLREELSRGRLSAGTIATLAAVATPENESALIETATVATGAQLQTLVRAYRQNTSSGSESEDHPPPSDSVSYGVRDGRWRMRADLDPSLGAQVEAAIRAEKEAEIADRREAPGDSENTDGPLSRDPEVSNAAALCGWRNRCWPARYAATASCPNASR